VTSRAVKLALVGVLLAGPPVRASRPAGSGRVRLQVRGLAPARVEALRKCLGDLPVRVRLVRTGRYWTDLVLTGGTSAELASAVRRLRATARAEGGKVSVRIDRPGWLQPARSGPTHDPRTRQDQRAGGWATPPGESEDTHAPARIAAASLEIPVLRSNRCSSPPLVRAPPA